MGENMSVSNEQMPWWVKITDCSENSQLIRRAEIDSVSDCITTTVITVRSGMQFETPDAYKDIETMVLGGEIIEAPK